MQFWQEYLRSNLQKVMGYWRTVLILKIFRTSGLDVMSSRAIVYYCCQYLHFSACYYGCHLSVLALALVSLLILTSFSTVIFTNLKIIISHCESVQCNTGKRSLHLIREKLWAFGMQRRQAGRHRKTVYHYCRYLRFSVVRRGPASACYYGCRRSVPVPVPAWGSRRRRWRRCSPVCKDPKKKGKTKLVIRTFLVDFP